MRLLHTSDWHLGRSLHGHRLLDEQAAAVDRLVEIARAQHVDVVVVAGDVYDRSVPPSEAVTLFDEAVVRLRDTGAHVVVIAGNHDSATRLSAGGRITERAGVAIRGPLTDLARPVLVPAGDGVAAVYAIPYLEPLVASAALASLDGDDADEIRALRLSQHALVTRAVGAARTDLVARRPDHAVVVAHTFVAGGVGSESERDIAVGGVEVASASAFAGFDYVALGHLHRPQVVAGDERIAYAGSPLPYSFSEQGDEKSVRIVELGDGTISVELLPIGVGTPLRSVRGTLDSLLTDPTLVDAEPCHVSVELTDAMLPRHAKARLEARFRRVLQLRHTPPATLGNDSPSSDDVAQRSPLELAEHFALDQLGSLSELQTDLLRRAVADAGAQEVSA